MSLTGILFIGLAFLHLGLLAWGWRLWRAGNHFLLPLLVIDAALFYDNLVIAFGALIGAGDTLYALSIPRFWAHALLTPLLAWVAYLLATRADLRFARSPITRIAMLGMVAFLTYAGVAPKLQADFDVYAICQEGTVRYSKSVYSNQFCTPDQTELSASPPIGSIGTIVVVLAWGIAFAWQRRFVVLLGGAVLMLIGGALPTRLVSPLVGNFSEVIVIAALYMTAVMLMTSSRAVDTASDAISDDDGLVTA